MSLQSLSKRILHIAIPSIISNITVPLLGLIDTAITGHLGAQVYLAAIAVGTTIFSTSYWLFTFLRTATGGLTAQALGAKQRVELSAVLWRSLLVAGGIGVLILILQNFILQIGLMVMDNTPEVEDLASTYFSIVIWGAPATLMLFVLNGWLLGMQDARSPMWVAIVQNVVNIVVSLLLVIGLGWKIEGVAMGTLFAKWVGVGLAFGFVLGKLKTLPSLRLHQLLYEHRERWKELFYVNRDIFLRTLCLVAVMFSFTAFGSRQGETMLAVNAVMMQCFLLVSYVMDGFAYAGEALGGRMCGAADRLGFLQLTRQLFLWGIALAFLFTVGFWVWGSQLFALLTDNEVVRQAALEFLGYLVAIPLVSFSAFLLDGLFVGTTYTRGLLIGVGTASIGYFALYHWLVPTLDNHAIWVAFVSYLGLRGAVQGLLLPKIVREKFVRA